MTRPVPDGGTGGTVLGGLLDGGDRFVLQHDRLVVVQGDPSSGGVEAVLAQVKSAGSKEQAEKFLASTAALDPKLANDAMKDPGFAEKLAQRSKLPLSVYMLGGHVLVTVRGPKDRGRYNRVNDTMLELARQLG